MIIILRSPKADDEPLIYATWTKNRWYSEARQLQPQPSKKEWFQQKIAEIKHFLELGHVLVACPQDDPDLIVGYAAYQAGKPVWTYVKPNYRKQGIATLLQKKAEA